MLTHEIRKPQKYSIFQRAVQQVFPPQRPYQPPVNLTSAPRQQQHHPKLEEIGVRAAIPSEHRNEGPDKYLDKTTFINFVEDAKKRWRVGDIVTLRIWPILQDRLDPPPWYTISDFQEMRQYATWDETFKELRVVGLRPGDNIRGGLFQFFAPTAIRELTDQEKFLVNLQHQKKLEERRQQREANEGYSG